MALFHSRKWESHRLDRLLFSWVSSATPNRLHERTTGCWRAIKILMPRFFEIFLFGMFHDRRRATHWHWNFISLGRRAVCRVHVNLFINHLTLKAFLAPLHTRWAFRSVDFSINKHFFLFWVLKKFVRLQNLFILRHWKRKEDSSRFRFMCQIPSSSAADTFVYPFPEFVRRRNFWYLEKYVNMCAR